MKKLFTENIGLKLGSIAIAIILWVLVVYTYDPAATTTFTIGVDIINGDSIASLGKVYEVVEGDTITIKVKANASLIKNLKASDFKATADVSKLSPTDHANIDVVCTKSDNVEITIIGSAKLLEVKLEDRVTKQFSVTVEKSGNAMEGYFVGDAVAKPNLITVSGGKNSIEKIASVKVVADINGAGSSFNVKGVPKAYDSDGNEITTGSLTFSDNPVSVAVKVYKTKRISVIVEASGEPYKGYSVQDIDYEPKSVLVAGDKNLLSRISSIRVPLDVEGKITDVEESISLSDFLESGIYLVDKDVTINAKCNIVRLGTKELEVLPTDISLNNKSDKFNYEFVNTEKLVVTLSGLSDKIKDIGVSDIAPYIDLSNTKEAGNYSYILKFRDIDGVKVETSNAVTIRVTDISGGSLENTGEDANDEASGAAIESDDKKSETKESKESKGTKEGESSSVTNEEGKNHE